ncbi:arginine N-succinyltransferase [Silvimonas amylolytica]|uniref:Arginine N-succinyltransferase subunit beta n=1 Tax=Silvimonas amylolytica TaxID=449663 RepID=A0ABQ2PIL3_9NEIS|nr:arginine N-succinyltransferase [Silvimonas amylolytica]GGP25143.1 arginine N-succinyltransferase subunit beta [Silvimonas amylolytica]
MIVVRSVQPRDLDALFQLAGQTGEGMTSFKPDRAALTARIERVRRTVAGEASLADQGYLFVMEDTASRRVVGVCGLEVAVGLTQPFYNYRVGTVVHASREMNVWTRMSLLYMSHDLTGYAELCSLFLEPGARVNGNGALLSKSRFMFLAQFSERFGERICAEMRGHFNEAGESPFWRDVGAHFYQIGFDDADYLSAHGKKSFMAELMPRSPVYVDLLPQDVQEAIGKTHKDTEPARVLLEAEGLRFENHVDIFDAGPVLEAHIDNLRAVRESRLVNVVVDDTASADGVKMLVSNTDVADFRVVLLPRAPQDGLLRLTSAEWMTLNINAGEQVRVLPLYPKERK